MNKKQISSKSSASVPRNEVTLSAHHVTSKEFAEWIKEIEDDASKREQPAPSADAQQKEAGKA
jgi:hypothetical protein